MTYERSADATPGDAGADTGASSELAIGGAVHRYVILDRVGEGGMGVVYAAYDRSLDRRVALKFLRAASGDRDGVRERRILREAQAMARLSHPNVAVVYEVGSFDGRVYLAMEFVDGVDLRAWLAAGPRSFAQILDIFRAAGRGLAAAHAAGIIHRDFKPENVLVDRAGRARVTDFGLSRASHECGEEPDDSSAGMPSSPSHLSTPLTRTGGVLGTPSYMPPEQHLGQPVDPRGDQFSFCVALHEAVYGEHPFGPLPERAANAIAGRVAPAPEHSPVPRWCRQAILRGLSPAPADRAASMDALLAALSPLPAGRRRPLALAAALVVALTGAGAYALWSDRAAATAPRCDHGARALAGIWDAARQSDLRAAFQRTGARGADVTWKSFAAIVDQRARAWAGMHDQACAATHIDGSQSAAVLDLRMECLERRRQEMRSLVEVYDAPLDQNTLDRAVTAADSLSSVAGCADITNLRAVVPLPDDPAVRTKVRSLRQRLSLSHALEEAGRYEQGREYMVSLKREADAIGYAPLIAEAGHALATHLSLGGKVDEAEQALFDAASHAVKGRDWRLNAEILVTLVGVYDMADRLREGQVAARVADLAIEQAAGDDALRARLAENRAYLDGAADILATVRESQTALRLWERSRGARSPRYAAALSKVGGVLLEMGRAREGMEHLERAMQLQESMLRPGHPAIASTMDAVGVAYQLLGRLERGRALLQSAPEIRRRELGPEHPEIAQSLRHLAQAETSLGNPRRGLELVESARDRPDQQGYSANALLYNVAYTQARAGRRDDAERNLQELIRRNPPGATLHAVAVGYSLTELGRLHNRRRLHVRARRECRRGLDLLSSHYGPDSPRLLDSRECLAEALLATGEPAAARTLLEPILAIDGLEEIGPQWTAGARFQLARALWATPDDRPKALELARATLNELAAAEGDNRELLARIRAWLSPRESVGNSISGVPRR
jgi:tetratricopeptide (TPR) repeat protein